jgi:NTE family protein
MAMTPGNPAARGLRGRLSSVRLLVFAVFAALPAGCAHAPRNVPLARFDAAAGYRSQPVPNTPDGTGLMVALFFSGGGTRAAAFSYGVLRELAATAVAGNRRMLDEVTTINAVSGGSFTAAYYCLYGDRIFADYERLFLKRDVEDALIHRCFSPVNSVRLASPHFGRSDLAAEYYDELLFHGATFGDLGMIGAPRPFLVINATDISTGAPLQFTQDQFDLIGSDLSRFPISRAVAASAAVPVLLTPITLKNYAGSVPPAGPVPVRPSGDSDVFASYRATLTEASRSYLDAAKHPYIYLMDGGLSDNLSLRNLLDEVTLSGGWEPVLERVHKRGVTKLAIIVVDATLEDAQGGALAGEKPDSKSVIRTLSNSSINRTKKETIAMVEGTLALWQAQLAGRGAQSGGQPKIYFIRVDFRSIADPAERAFFESIPTSLHLPSDTVDRLVRGGERLLRESPAYQTLLRDVPPGLPAPPAADSTRIDPGIQPGQEIPVAPR